jgi:hypothetical protein
MPNRETGNNSEASRESRIMELAVWDWRGKPVNWIRQQLDNCHYQTLCDYRKTPLYLSTLEELKQAWRDSILRLPETRELKHKVTQGMALGLDRLIGILADDRSAPKDAIAAARLMAQMDGRFLRPGEDDDSMRKDVDSVAQELLTAVERHRGVVN